MAGSKEGSKVDAQVQDQIVVISERSGDVSSKTDGETLEESKPTLDYAGSTEKTDPEEIRLVRKLDCWILVSPST